MKTSSLTTQDSDRGEGNSLRQRSLPTGNLFETPYPPGASLKIDQREMKDEPTNATDLIQQRDEALKKEEAARDRLKLQEAINAKQVQELRAQIRKLVAENQRLQRSPSVASYSSKSDSKKRDGKSREVRELNKAMDLLKNEKLQLRKKVDDMSQFIQTASSLKEHAIAQCHQKNEVIFNLRQENEIANQLKEDEVCRRFQVEGELESLRAFLDYTTRKSRDKYRSKAVQTTTTIPVKAEFKLRSSSAFGHAGNSSVFSLPGARNNVKLSNGSGAVASYNALKSAASLWQLKLVENQFHKQTLTMKKRFTAVADPRSTASHAGADVTAIAGHRHSYPQQQVKSSNPRRKVVDSIASGGNLSKNRSSRGRHSDPVLTQSQLEIDNRSKPMPPPPPPPHKLESVSNVTHKYTRHSAAMAPAAIVYNARIGIES